MAKKIKESEEFKERKAILDLQKEVDIKKHEMKMEELVFIRENNKLHHANEMERQRIKSAEIRKSQERREFASLKKVY